MSITLSDLGLSGDFIGGIIGTIVSVVTIYFVYLTYTNQKKELQLQREELKESRIQQKQQQFETSFFNIMNMLKSSVNDMVYHKTNLRMDINFTPETFKGLSIFTYLYDTLSEIHFSKDSKVKSIIITRIKQDYPSEIRVDPDESDFDVREDNLQQWIKESPSHRELYVSVLYSLFTMTYDKVLDPFFNTIQFLLEELDKTNNSKFYVRLIQSQLTNEQLFVLFYHCIDQPELKDLVDKHQLLEKLDPFFLLNSEDTFFYPKTEFVNGFYDDEEID